MDQHCLGMRGGKKFKGAIAGGVSMGALGPDQFDAAMDFDIGRKCQVPGLGTPGPRRARGVGDAYHRDGGRRRKR